MKHVKIVQFSSVAQSCPTLCNPMNRSTSGLPVHHHLLEFTHTHVHRVSDAIQPSHPLSSPLPPAPNPSQHYNLLSLPDTITTRRFHFGSATSFFPELFFCSSPIAYETPTDLRGSFSSSYIFAFSYCSWGSQGKNTEMVFHSLLQWATFCQNSPP